MCGGEPEFLVDAKKFSTSGTFGGLSFTSDSRAAREETDETIYNEIKTFINKLAASNLVTKEAAQILNEKNNNHFFTWEIEVANEAYRITNEEYFLKPKSFNKYLEALLKTNIIDENGFKQLSDLSAKGSLHQYNEIFPFLKRSVVIDLNTLPARYEEFLGELYKRTAGVLPGLNFENINFKDVVDNRESFEDFIAHNLLVSFQVSNKKYSYSSYYDDEIPNKTKVRQVDDADKWKIPEQYYQIFNKVLADNLSPYKLHSFNVDRNHIGIIALTEEQSEEVSWTYDGALESYLSVSYEDYSVKMTSDKIKQALKIYDSIGLFSSMTKARTDSIIEDIMSSDINSYIDILRKFDKIIVDLDAEYGVDDAQYKSITQQLSGISNNNFLPVDIIDTYSYENKNFKYGFNLNGKQYLADLHQEDDWLDFNFWELIKQAVKEQNKNGKFYELEPSDGLTAIYLTSDQYEILKQKKVLEFADADL